MPRTYSITFQPGDEIDHVIAKNFDPVKIAQFNPGVENAPCNRPLSYTFVAGGIRGQYFLLETNHVGRAFFRM